MAVILGMMAMPDLQDARITEVGVAEFEDSIARSLAEHNRQVEALTSLFTTPTTEFKTRFRTPINARLQPLDENGRARPIKPAGYYDVAFPLKDAGTAWGYNYVAGAYMTVAEAKRATMALQDADSRSVRDWMLGALFHKNGTSPWTFTDELHGSLSVYGLANSDTVTYSIQTGADSGATDDHLKGTAALTAATFADVYDELMEHPENGGEVITFISSAYKATVEALGTFYPVIDNDIRPGSGTSVLTGTLGVNVPGTVLGKVENNWIVEWKSMPSNYMISVTTNGERPLARREDPIAELRGFHLAGDRTNYPWFERQYRRRVGFGGWNRVGAIVYRTNNGTYAVPTNYDQPMI